MKKWLLFFVLLFNSHILFAKTNQQISLNSESALVFDEGRYIALIEKNKQNILPIASISKLMTAIIYLENNKISNKDIEITDDDVDKIKNSSSKIPVNSTISDKNLIWLALSASDNRAAHALARTSSLQNKSFIDMMNIKAKNIGMNDTFFEDPTGLSKNNVSTAKDLLLLLEEAKKFEIIKEVTTERTKTIYYTVKTQQGIKQKISQFNNTNTFLHKHTFDDILIGKTGFINESGVCIVMETLVNKKLIKIVLLNAGSKQKREQDVLKIKKYVSQVL